MPRSDTTSRYAKRPRGVAFGFQVPNDRIKPEGNVSNNVFSNHPSGSQTLHNPEHCGPQVARVFGSSLLACGAKWLAGVSTMHKLNCWQFAGVNRSHIVVNPHVRPPCRQHRLAKLVALAKGHGLKSCPFGGNVQPANPGKQAQCVHGKDV